MEEVKENEGLHTYRNTHVWRATGKIMFSVFLWLARPITAFLSSLSSWQDYKRFISCWYLLPWFCACPSAIIPIEKRERERGKILRFSPDVAQTTDAAQKLCVDKVDFLSAGLYERDLWLLLLWCPCASDLIAMHLKVLLHFSKTFLSDSSWMLTAHDHLLFWPTQVYLSCM